MKVILPEISEWITSKCISFNFDAVDSGFQNLLSTKAALQRVGDRFTGFFVPDLRHMTLKL